jgi:signal transduction histidine kinase/DNA-binding response OmpR family regulator
MKWLHNMSIRAKLVALNMTITGLALIMAFAILLYYDYRQIRADIASQWISFNSVVAENSTASIAFNDSDAAASNLRSLSAEDELQVAAIYKNGEGTFAKYIPPGSKSSPPARIDFTGSRFGPNLIEVATPIILNGKEIGRTYTCCDLREMYAQMRSTILTFSLVLLGTLTGAFFLINRLQRVISGPILNLTSAIRMVSTLKDYTVRVGGEGPSDDELGILISCFNDMLGEVQRRDLELTRHREHLEEEVSSRTNQLRLTNTELLDAKTRAEAASAAKSAFLANMSHEIRTPMTAIVGYADTMLEPQQTLSDRQDALQTIRRNGHHLLELINDILDISKIEAGKMTVEIVPADLPGVLSDLLSLMRPRALDKGLDFRLEVEGAVPRTIPTDPLRLRQVLINLLGNAVKFTEKGRVSLHVACETQADQRIMRFDICDSGIGIPAEKIELLFRPFAQADESMTRRFGGTGLGLTISRRLANLLGGDVTIQSVYGTGSVFTVRFPVGNLEGVEMIDGLTEAILPRPKSTAPTIWKLAARILLVEDGVDNQRLISMHLRKAGADVTIAENGRIGVDKAVEMQATQPFDLILMDMQMPELDGYGAASELRRRGFTLPIVALTAHAMAEDRDKCLKAGCSDYLTKPIDKNLLLGTVVSHMNQNSASDSTSSFTAAFSPSQEVFKPPADRIHSAYESDPDMKEVVAEFVAGLPEQVKRLNELLAQGQLEELRRATHQLKGSGGGYGFQPITDIAAKAEKLIKSSDPIETIAAQVRELINVIQSVEGFEAPKNDPIKS